MAYIQSHGGQSWLLPPSLEDMITEDHICYLIEGLMDSLDCPNDQFMIPRVKKIG